MPPRIDHTNKKYNYITVLEYAYSTDKRTFWKVRCDCGKEYIANIYSVSHGDVKSCGCQRLKLIGKFFHLQNGEAIIREAYRNHLEGAKRRNFKSYLSLEDYSRITKNPCSYCGTLSKRKNRHTKEVIELNSVDRLNNEPFYTKANSVACCFVCQELKGALSFNKFKKQVKLISAYLK